MIKKIYTYIIDELMLLPILIVNWSLWIVGSAQKIIPIVTGNMWIAPDGWIPYLKIHFHGTFIDPFVIPLFFFLTVLETLAAIFLTLSLLRLEFLDHGNKTFFKAGLFFAALAIAFMSFGQNVVSDFTDVFHLSSYLTTTLLSYLFLLLHPASLKKRTQ